MPLVYRPSPASWENGELRRAIARRLVLWAAVLIATAGCRPASPVPAAPAAVSPQPTLAPTATPTATRVASAPVLSATPSATSQPSPTPESTPAPTATPDPYSGYAIEALAARAYGGGLLEIVDTLETNDDFTRYLITYPSDGLTLYGFMNVPNAGDNFPVALVLHGYIPPAEYETLAYTRRYADALAQAGYFVIHPNYRNYPPSDEGSDLFRVGTAIDILNLIAIVREQSQDPLGTLRRADADQIHLLGHSMGGGVALRVITVNPAAYLRAAALYGSMSGDEALNYGRIRDWSAGRNGDFELAAPPQALLAISPAAHYDRIEAAVAVHHGSDDATVPPEWSDQLCAGLSDLFATGAIPTAPECHVYPAQPHTFRGDGDRLLIDRVIDFFNRH